MADYVWARDGMILGANRVAGTDADEVEALPSRAIQRYLDKGLIAVKQSAPQVAQLWQSNGDASAIIPVDNADSWIVGSDRMAQDTADTTGTKHARAFFNKAKGAFRAGRAVGALWDDANVGMYSFAEGTDTRASGQDSHAEGNNTVASAWYSHAEGSQTTAAADYSHAEGRFSWASALHAHAEGYDTKAQGDASHAEGSGTTASGSNSHAEGNRCTASQPNAHAEGDRCQAHGIPSHAEGETTEARGHYGSHAEGLGTRANGNSSHAEGEATFANGTDSHAQGNGAVASRYAQFAKASGYFVPPGGTFATIGDAQIGNMVLRRATADATAALLTANESATVALTGADTNVLTLPASRTFKVKIDVVARRTDVAGEHAGWSFEGVIARDATGSAYFVSTLEGKAWGTTAAAAWDMTPSINTVDATNNYLALTATGEALKTIRWVASINWVEVG